MWSSTKNKLKTISFSQALVKNMPSDGGLYIPTSYFNVKENGIKDFKDFAKVMLRPYFKGDILEPYLNDICDNAFDFEVPLKKLNEKTFILELFHGPTLAFKDIGAKFLAECFHKLYVLDKKKKDRVVLVATSGDTGAAVASAFYRKEGIKVVLLFPKDKISARQKKQLTCWGENVYSFAVGGVFDDCQKMVKTLLVDQKLSEEVNLISANSISIGRLLPQTIYYAFSSLDYKRQTGQKASFIIPTGNMGNAVACFWAREMSLPIENIILSTNRNCVIPSFFENFSFAPKDSIKTLANSMDVGNPSNMERLQNLFEDNFQGLKNFSSSYSVDDYEIKKIIVEKNQPSPKGWDYLLCPHTATAAYIRDRFLETPFIIVATAHPSKFNETIEPLIEQKIPVPRSLDEIIKKTSQYETISDDVQILKKFIYSL